MSHPKTRLTSDGTAGRAVDAFSLEILAGGEGLVSVVLSLVWFFVFFFSGFVHCAAGVVQRVRLQQDPGGDPWSIFCTF